MHLNYINYIFYSANRHLRLGYLGCSGRNNSGKITVLHKCSGHKKRLYKIDFFRRLGLQGLIIKVIKTPFFSSFLGCILYTNGLISYILLSEGQLLYTWVYSGLEKAKSTDLVKGDSTMLCNLNLFSLVNNIELLPYKGSQLARSAGCSGLIISEVGVKYILLKLKSGWNLLISKHCICTFGIVSNLDHRIFRNSKAGYYNKALGRRPKVRGIAMNPCDHPHGGGEGRKSGSRAARSPWGWLTKGSPSKRTKIHLIRKKKFKSIISR